MSVNPMKSQVYDLLIEENDLSGISQFCEVTNSTAVVVKEDVGSSIAFGRRVLSQLSQDKEDHVKIMQHLCQSGLFGRIDFENYKRDHPDTAQKVDAVKNLCTFNGGDSSAVLTAIRVRHFSPVDSVVEEVETTDESLSPSVSDDSGENTVLVLVGDIINYRSVLDEKRRFRDVLDKSVYEDCEEETIEEIQAPEDLFDIQMKDWEQSIGKMEKELLGLLDEKPDDLIVNMNREISNIEADFQ